MDNVEGLICGEEKAATTGLAVPFALSLAFILVWVVLLIMKKSRLRIVKWLGKHTFANSAPKTSYNPRFGLSIQREKLQSPPPPPPSNQGRADLNAQQDSAPSLSEQIAHHKPAPPYALRSNKSETVNDEASNKIADN